MQQVVFLLLIGLVLIQADSLLEMDAHCAEECGSPEYDELVKELDHQDEVLNDLVTRAVNVEHSLDQSKKEHDDADRESRNLLLRLDRLHSDKEHDVCPKKHRKCLTSAARDGKPCVANILVCDGEEDCLDGSDEDPELCKFPLAVGERWYAHAHFQYCRPDETNDFYQDIVIESFEHFDNLKSFLKVNVRLYWISSSVEVRSFPVKLTYSYAEKMAGMQVQFKDLQYILRYYFSDDAIVGQAEVVASGKVCSSAVFVPENYRKQVSV